MWELRRHPTFANLFWGPACRLPLPWLTLLRMAMIVHRAESKLPAYL